MDGRAVSRRALHGACRPAAASRGAPAPAARPRLALGLLAAALLASAGAARALDPVPAPTTSPPRVSAVELVLPPGEAPAAAAELLSVAPGDRLSPRALRTAVQRLYQTGRYRNVILRTRPTPGPGGEAGEWVELTVEALPQRRIGRLQIRSLGHAVLPDDGLRAAARLNPGDPLDDAELTAATDRVRAALARRGYQAARVTATVKGDTGAVVELSVEAGEPTRVQAVRLEGDAAPAAAALAGLATRPGAVLDQDQLVEDARVLRSALHAAGYRRARIGTPAAREGPDGVEVVFPVTAGPRIQLLFQGNATLPAALLEKQMGLEPDQPLDATALDAALERLQAGYRARGFAAARLEVQEQPRGKDLLVRIRVVEGARYRVTAIHFEGAEAHPEPRLRERLLALLAEDQGKRETPEADLARQQGASLPEVAVRPGLPPVLAAGDFYEETSWDRAVERMVEDDRAEGYLEAAFLGTSVELDAVRRTVEVRVRLREGPRTWVEAVEFEGNQVLTTEELAGLARLAPADPLVYVRVEETRSAVLRRYATRGRVFARVEIREQLDVERHSARLRYRIDEGPEVHVGRVLVSGNRRTREDLIRRNVRLREGELYDPEAAARSQTALLDLGVFRSVAVRLQDPDVPQETKDVVVELGERPYATLTQAIGFSIANGPRVMLEYVRPNLMGRALELSLRGKVNYPTNAFGLRPDLASARPGDRVEGQLDAGVRTARLDFLPVPATARLNLIGEVVHRPAYDLRRVSAVTGLDAGLTSRATFSLQYELEVDIIGRTGAVGHLTQVDLERLRFDEGTTTLQAFRPTFALDYRDNSTHPERGWFASGTAEYSHSLGVSGSRVLGLLPGSDIHSNLVKLSGLLSGYVPLGGHTVLALSARAGQVFPLDPRSRTIVPRRFFMGGASSLRGFGEEQLIQEDVRAQLAREGRLCATSPTGAGCTERGRRIADGNTPVSEGGEAFLLGKAELRLPVAGRLELGLFVDAGNLWLDPKRIDPRDLRPCAGVGVRFVTPIGPAALDLGFNLDRDDQINETVFAPHFTIGLF
jgi:outer membrane protein insertion porin family